MNKLKELKVFFETENIELTSELIADCFYKNEITGVVVESPEERTDEWGDDAIIPEDYSVTGYIYEEEEFRIDLIKNDIKDLSENMGFSIKFETGDIEEEDWAHSWKDFFYPVEVSENIVIKPTWRELERDYNIVINIDPGMAFGSGSHPTTNLCIRLLEEKVVKGDEILDIGCGSGILMIAASKLKAGHVTGIDNDIAAVEISKENLELNQIDPDLFDVFKSDLTREVDNNYDLIVANILAEVIVELIPDLKNVKKENTRVIFSGIIKEKKDMVIKKMEEFNIEPDKILEESGWVAISGIIK